MSEMTLPAGMKAWAGGDSAPEDWDGGPVLRRSGTLWGGVVRWWHIPGDSDIIAYTPRANPTPPASTDALREALEASLAKRSQPTMDRVWTAAFNAALDMVDRDTAAARAARTGRDAS